MSVNFIEQVRVYPKTKWWEAYKQPHISYSPICSDIDGQLSFVPNEDEYVILNGVKYVVDYIENEIYYDAQNNIVADSTIRVFLWKIK